MTLDQIHCLLVYNRLQSTVVSSVGLNGFMRFTFCASFIGCYSFSRMDWIICLLFAQAFRLVCHQQPTVNAWLNSVCLFICVCIRLILYGWNNGVIVVVIIPHGVCRCASLYSLTISTWLFVTNISQNSTEMPNVGMVIMMIISCRTYKWLHDILNLGAFCKEIPTQLWQHLLCFSSIWQFITSHFCLQDAGIRTANSAPVCLFICCITCVANYPQGEAS